MQALVLIGHGSLRKASGAAMLRLAALARREGLAPVTAACFLNFSRPTLEETLARCIARGATEVTLQPYFLISGYYVRRALPQVVSAMRQRFPQLIIRQAPAFDFHPALVDMVTARAEAARTAGSSKHTSALLLMAHGSPLERANQPIHRVVSDLRRGGGYRGAELGFMELNRPGIAQAAQRLIAQGAEHIVAVPYFLQLGGHVAEDLPRITADLAHSHPEADVVLSDYLSYDPKLLEVIRNRTAEARSHGVC